MTVLKLKLDKPIKLYRGLGNYFGENIYEQIIREMANAMESLGMVKAC